MNVSNNINQWRGKQLIWILLRRKAVYFHKTLYTFIIWSERSLSSGCRLVGHLCNPWSQLSGITQTVSVAQIRCVAHQKRVDTLGFLVQYTELTVCYVVSL